MDRLPDTTTIQWHCRSPCVDHFPVEDAGLHCSDMEKRKQTGMGIPRWVRLKIPNSKGVPYRGMPRLRVTGIVIGFASAIASGASPLKPFST